MAQSNIEFKVESLKLKSFIVFGLLVNCFHFNRPLAPLVREAESAEVVFYFFFLLTPEE
jgi:hypothetical protein